MSGREPLLSAHALAVDRGRRRVLSGIDLELAAGEALVVVGPNAAGKSTLVRALAGLLEPAAGEVRLGGRALQDWPRDARARALALATSEEDGPDALRVVERVALGRYPHRGPFQRLDALDQAAIARALAQTGIAPLAERRLGTLSAGERQLATLARGLAQEPRVLLLDEPAAHLDIGHQLQLYRTLDEVRRAGVAVLAVVHDLARAATWADRMLLVARGRVVAEGVPGCVLASEAASRAFGVRIRGHAIPSLAEPHYSFEPDPGAVDDAPDRPAGG
jgi:ABC-type cobalamin/Fe3+-siderophores transport system ATPase subunit